MTKRKTSKKTSKPKEKKSTVRRQESTTSPTRGGTRNRKTGARRTPDTDPSSGSDGGSSRLPSIRKLSKPDLSNISVPKLSVPKFSLPNIKFEFNPRRKALILGFVLLALTLLLVLGLLSTNRGVITGGAINFLWSFFGWGMPAAIVAIVLLGFWLLSWGLGNSPEFPVVRVVGGVVLFGTFETFITLIAVLRENGTNTFETVLAAQTGGGLIGYLSAQTMMNAVGLLGTVFVLCIIGMVSAVLVSGMRWQDIGLMFQPETAPPSVEGTANQPALPFLQRLRGAVTTEPAAPTVQDDLDDELSEEDEVLPWIEPPAPEATEAATEPSEPAPVEQPKSKRRGRRGKKEAKEAAPAQPTAAPAPLVLGRGSPQNNPTISGNMDDNTPPPSWQLPGLEETLHKGGEQSTDDTHIHKQVLIIEETLTGFGAPVQVVDIKQGPTIIQYCVEPQYLVQKSGKRTKVKVGKIASLADDLALALAARSVRVQAPVPGKAYVGIEVPNESKAVVSLRDVMESKDFAKVSKKAPLTIGLGEDVSGQPLSIDLAKMPHMLIAGATGSGKSVCINALIACLLLQNTPEQLQMVMVDPKRVELTGYNGIPHLAAPVVVDMERVTGTLQWALREMDNRYKQFANVGARNITEYNKMMKRQKKRNYPFIVIIIDELADLMMLAPDETEKSIARLAQMARATGIHMILATQRPSVDVVTGLIKANFPARVAFAVASSTDSRVVLDTTGAERLLGQGDMLFQSPDAPAPVRMQGCFVSDEELNVVIDYWKAEKRRAMGQTEDGRQVNRLSAATEKVSKSALDHDIWDVDSEEEKRRKEVALKQIKKDSAERAPYIPTPHTQEIRPPARKSTPKPNVKPAEPVVAEKPTAAAEAEETAVDPKSPTRPAESEHQPPLWAELRDEVELAQEEAIYEQQTFHDELWDEAVAFVRSSNKASVSLLQRKFRIGYTRSARLIDRMEEDQIIGPPTGNSKAREVMFSGHEEEEEGLEA